MLYCAAESVDTFYIVVILKVIIQLMTQLSFVTSWNKSATIPLDLDNWLAR